MAFERVFTVWDYWDGPRSGVALFFGEPHHYQSEESEDGYTDAFFLTPIRAETLSLAMEQWAIWREWETAFHRGEVPQSTHPGLPDSNRKYAELQAILNTHLSQQATNRRKAYATFQTKEGQQSEPLGVLRELEVEWLEEPNG